MLAQVPSQFTQAAAAMSAAEQGHICFAETDIAACSGTCHSQSREGTCLDNSRNLGFSLFNCFFFLGFVLGKKIALDTITGILSPSAFCPLPSLPFCHLAHPFFLFFLSTCSSPCCPHWHWVWLPFSPRCVSIARLLPPQKAARCSEHARTASCPFLALKAEQMLSQLSSVRRQWPSQRHPLQVTAWALAMLFCQRRGETHCSSRRGQQALGSSPVPYPWR